MLTTHRKDLDSDLPSLSSVEQDLIFAAKQVVAVDDNARLVVVLERQHI